MAHSTRRPVSYEDLHDGKQPPRGRVSVRRLCGPVRVIGEIAKISYVSDRDDGVHVREHEFEPHDGRGPLLLEAADEDALGLAADGASPGRIENPRGEMAELGQLVDVETTDGERIVVAGAMLGATEDGDLLIASEDGVPIQVEPRRGAHYISERGIEE